MQFLLEIPPFRYKPKTMEMALLTLLTQGGWIAVAAFCVYMLFRLEKRIDRLEEKFENMVSREEHYRDLSGWRGEIQRLDDKISRMFEKLLEVRK